MKQDKKQLLLKDLCARLPYGVKVKSSKSRKPVTLSLNVMTDFYLECSVIPYLRPISSMTEEEKKDLLETIVGKEGVEYFQVLEDGSIVNTDDEQQDLHNFSMHWINFDVNNTTSYINWLNAHHFDYRGLIKLGLGIEAPADMYNIE